MVEDLYILIIKSSFGIICSNLYRFVSFSISINHDLNLGTEDLEVWNFIMIESLLFNSILQSPIKQSTKEIKKFIEFVVTKMVKNLNEYPMLYIDVNVLNYT